MTNYEAMRTMDKDELVEFLSSIMDGEAIRTMDKGELTEFLLSIVDCKKCPASEKFCDVQRECVDAILEWLADESDDDTVVEHSEGQTINISHANPRTVEYTNPPKNDEIHHPDHYTWKGTECKEVIEIMTQGLSGAEAYYMGNIIKYLYRYPKKGTLYSDLAKAEEYTKFLRELFIEDGGKPK